MDELSAELDVLRADLGKKQSSIDRRAEKVNSARREVSKRNEKVKESTKTIVSLESEIERNAVGRFQILRRCKFEEIKIPLESGSLENLPMDIRQNAHDADDPDAMDLDDNEDAPPVSSAVARVAAQDFGLVVDFDDLDDDLKSSNESKIEEELQDRIKTLTSSLDLMAPNMKAITRLEDVSARLADTDAEFEKSRKDAKTAKDKFQTVKEKRGDLFHKAFRHIQEQIVKVYKDLTKAKDFPLGGSAYLDLEETTEGEPYLDGIRYHAMPPSKRFRDMEHLSGGEKTMAALALLFAVHTYQPSPFFVLDEVDAALDNANVARIKEYIRTQASPGFQFIVISLKAGLFQGSESLVGIYRDQVECSSRSLTLDVSILSLAGWGALGMMLMGVYS